MEEFSTIERVVGMIVFIVVISPILIELYRFIKGRYFN